MPAAAQTPAIQPPAAPPRQAKRPADLSDPVTSMPSIDEIKKETTPFSDADWRVRVYSWLGFLLRILTICAAIVTAVQYFAVREEKRVERTLDLVTLWEQPKYQDAQNALNARLNPLIGQADVMLGSEASEADRAVAYSKIGMAVMSEKGGAMPLAEFKSRFGDIIYFLNRLAFCVQSNLCSRTVSDAYFRDFAVSVWTYFAGYIVDQRRRYPNYARPLEDYVKSKGDAGWFSLLWPATPSDAGGATP